MEIRVTSHDIAAVGAAVRALGDGRTIVNEMAREIRTAVPPVRVAVKAHTLATLPKKGGYNTWVAAAPVRVSVKRGPRSAGVSLYAGKAAQGYRRADLKRLDSDGRLRHPLFGNRHHWYPQQVAPGWFTLPVHDHTDDFRGAIVVAVDKARVKVGL